MSTPDRKITELVDIVKSWIPRRSESVNVSRDFWMPDQSCRVCYECDSQFTVFNRKHHCRLCGRVFCAKCTENSVPSPSVESRTSREDWDRIRVCNYCFKQWEGGLAGVDNGTTCVLSPDLSTSPSAASLASSKSSATCNSSNSTIGSTPYSTGRYHCVPYDSGVSPRQSAQMDPGKVEQDNVTSGRSSNPSAAVLSSSPNQFSYCMNRSDDDDDDYGVYQLDSEVRQFSRADDYYGAVNVDEIDHVYESDRLHLNGGNIDSKNFSTSPSPDNFGIQGVDIITKPVEEVYEHGNGDECKDPSYNLEESDRDPVDFENNGLLWLPPEPEDEDDDREAVLIEEEDDDEGATGEWGYLRSSNGFGSGEFRSREKSGEEHRKAVKNVVEGHFRALVSQLLRVENISVGEDDKDSWLDIVTSLSWEASTLLKPDTSKGGGMDPGGYVKVKCIASGQRSESMAVKGVVCKKNVAHRRMTSNINKPRFLILGGALEYQRVSTHLSSFDTLLQQEMDHLKMAVAKIDAHHPNVLLVEKSVSRYAQEYLLAKDISLVLNIKRPLLERIARCTGAQIVPSIDHLISPKLGYCDMFHVDKFLEEHGSAGQGGKKLTKTLMFFEGCPKPLGCTILLKGASGDELKKVKHVVQYGVFAAYHLALETSFLADERASLPELPLKNPITVALPDKPSSIDKSISTIPGFAVPASGKSSSSQPITKFPKSKKDLISDTASFTYTDSVCKLETALSACLSKGQDILGSHCNELSSDHVSGVDAALGPKEFLEAKTANSEEKVADDHLDSSYFGTPATFGEAIASGYADGNSFAANHYSTPELSSLKQDNNSNNEERGSSKEEFPPSPSDHQSILVSLSTRCLWKGTVCERAHRFRIKYYGSFDKPLGRFLHDDLFDQSYRCRSCDMPSEAHVHCYTHRQGSLTISVKKLLELPLPGESEGKIWMWHRCLRCPRITAIPPATRRVVMSDAAWGLSFGKFLELSFSNHAAASRVASCGHSLHRDCLRFYGFGKMVACFRYASIDVHSVYLPPLKVEFHSGNQEWIQKEANEVRSMAERMFTEVYNALNHILEKRSSAQSEDGDLKSPESRQRLTDLEEMLQKEKQEFEESLRKVLFGEMKAGQPIIDILEINKLRRQILFHSYDWDQRLIHAASSKSNAQERQKSCIPKLEEKPLNTAEKLAEMSMTTKPGKGFCSCESFLSDTKSDLNTNQGGNAGYISQSAGDSTQRNDTEECLSSIGNISDKPEALESENVIRRARSEGEFPIMASISDTLDAAWTGESPTTSITAKENGSSVPNSTNIDSSTISNSVTVNRDLETSTLGNGGIEATHSLGSTLPTKETNSMENSASAVGTSFLNFRSSFSKNYSLNAQKLGISEYNPVYVSLFKELERQSGARLLLPVGVNDTVVPVYDDEPTSIIAYALVSSDYHVQMSQIERRKEGSDSSASLPNFDSVSLLALNSLDETASDTYSSVGFNEESILSMAGTWSSFVLDPLLYTKDLHVRVAFTDDGPLGKVKYLVTCYYAKRFDALRRACCPSERDFIRSLSRCKKWGAQGGKSNVFFAKTLDDRFIVKQVTKTELESFIKFAPGYFKYISESISTRSPTCLAKILGIYQVSSKHRKGGKESKMDVLVMENLLFRRNVSRLYDLKGSSRSRYNPDTSGSNKVLLDQNLIEAMPTSPIFVGSKAKRVLERAVWNDTSFLASIDVMDYSLLVGVDEENHELILGIIDFVRQYTWDKHLETWVKTTGILGGPRNTTPTVISPQQYKKRFRKAMSTYFIMMPEQWSSPTILPSESQSDLCE